MAKQQTMWILIILIVIGGFFYYSYKKEATGHGLGYWDAQEFTPTNDIIQEVALTIKNNLAVPNPTGGVEIYIANRKEVNDRDNTIIYSYTLIPDSQIDTTRIKFYDIGDAEVPRNQKLYLVTHVVNREPSPNYVVMTNLNNQPGQYYGSFDGINWMTKWLDVYDIEYDLIPPNANCNTPADTNCDNCVATSELISLINKWVSNTETTSNLITAINAWTSGTC